MDEFGGTPDGAVATQPAATYPPPAQPFGPPKPGYAAAPAPPAPRRLAGLVTALTVLLPLAAVVSAVTAFSFFERASLLAGDRLSTLAEALEADENVVNTVLGVALLTLATGVVWIVWQYRHAKNAELLGHRTGPAAGWAIGGWFVPFGTMIIPQLQLLRSARVSAGGASPLLRLWWLAHVASWVLILAGPQIDDLPTADRTMGAGFGLLAVTAVLAMLVVRDSSARQQRALTTPGLRF